MHPLQGQATYLVNAALSYVTQGRRHRGGAAPHVDRAAARRRSTTSPLPDIYEAPTTSFDADAVHYAPGALRLKLPARNLLDPRVRLMLGEHESSGYHTGRSFSVALSFGS